MTQNEVDIIKNYTIDATEAYVEARLAVADFVKTQIGVVTSSYKDSSTKKWTHTVRCNATRNTAGITYNNVLSVNNIHFQNNSVVFMIVPNAQYSNQFILGKLDNVPYDIVGGSIKIGGTEDDPNFYVDSDGKAYCKYIEANTGGQIGGFTISADGLQRGSNSWYGEFRAGCGYAGNGIINLVGGTDSTQYGYIQISDSGDPYTCKTGIRIYYTGVVKGYDNNGSETWSVNLWDIP